MNRRCPIPAGSLFLAVLVTAPAAAQEAVLLRLNAPQGQVSRYQTVVETFMQGGPMAMMGGDPNQPMTRITMSQTQTLTAVAGDTLTFSQVVDSARFEMPAMPQAAAMMGGAAEQMRGMVTVTKMDRRGRIYDVERTGGPMGGPGAGPGGPPGGMGGRRGGMMGSSPGGRNNPMFLLPDQAVRPGDTWSDSMSVENQPGQPNSMFRATFRLERVENRVAVVSMTGTMDVPTPGGPTTMNLAGEFRLDTAQQLLAAMTMTLSGTMRTEMGEVPMRVQMNTTAM